MEAIYYMVKHGIRLTSIVLAIFTFILTFQNVMIKQQQLPFDTAEQFEINISKTDVSKEKLVDSLNELTDQNNGILVKVTINSESYENAKDIIWFGKEKPFSNKMVVDEQKIKWLDSKLKGELISSEEIGSRPLYGTYAIKGNEHFKDEITKWANDNGVIISWIAKPPLLKSIYYNLVHGGGGNAIITAFLLYLATLIAWFVTHAKARTIRLLGGVSSKRIHKEDTISIMKITTSGILIAWIAAIGYVIIANDIRQIKIVLQPSIISLIILLILSCLFTLLISNIVRPKVEHLASRKIPLKRFRQLGTVTRIISIILALLIIPSTITSAYILKELSKEYSLWENMQNNVSLSFGDLDSLGTNKMLPNVQKFFSDMEKKDNLSLSLVIDKAILLNEEEYGGYDHIIITDKAWINSFNIGITKKEKGGKLTKKDFNSLEKPLQDFLIAQMSIWTKSGEVQPQGVGFYEFTGSKFLALPPNVGYGGSTVQAKNPLVILIDKPTSSLKIDSFMLPAASSGNVVFPDEEKLRLSLADSSIKEYVVSIDTIADVALEQSQKFAKEAIFYFIACVLIFISMIFTGIMNAQLWAGSNKKRIFTLHTFGISYSEIIQTPFKKELIIAVLTIVAGSILSFIVRHPQVLTLLGVSVAIMVLYGLGNLIAFHVCVRKSFLQTAQRND